jgi:hypothetical protein
MSEPTPDTAQPVAKKPGRTPEQVRRDRVKIAELYAKGTYQHVIADEISKQYPFTLSRSLIAKELGKIYLDWQRRADEAIGKVKARQLAAIDAVERTAWERFEASMKPAERTQQERESGETAPDSAGKKLATASKSKARVVKENRDGDPRWLDLVLKCVERRCKILGIDAPSRGVLDIEADVTHTGTGPTPAPTQELDGARAWDVVMAEAKEELARTTGLRSLGE